MRRCYLLETLKPDYSGWTSNPASLDKLNFEKEPQVLVDAAFLATALLRAPQALWLALSEEVKGNLVAALRFTRNIRPFFNNWLLFSAVIEAFFCKNDLQWDSMRIDYALRQHEQWYLGDGIYGDGAEFHADYYNSFVIQPLILEILWAVSEKSSVWKGLHDNAVLRAQRHAIQLERLIGVDGTFPPLGRSLTYRCCAFHLLALLAWKRLLPAQIKPAQVRSALLATIEKTLGSELNYDENGWLRIGLNGSQPELGENYISNGSLYLCSTAFLPLGLPGNEEFWSSPTKAWTQRQLWWLQLPVKPDQALKPQ